MAKRFICEGDTYEVGPRGDVIGLPVSFSNVPASIQVEGNILFLRDAFHVSLVCIGKIIEKNKISDPDFTNKIINDFCTFTKEKPIEIVSYRDEFRFVEEDEKKSVVIMCDLKNLDVFFNQLNERYSLNVEYPPTHVTLYTLDRNAGIFLTNSDDIHRLTKKIVAPIGTEILV